MQAMAVPGYKNIAKEFKTNIDDSPMCGYSSPPPNRFASLGLIHIQAFGFGIQHLTHSPH
jgi:hypothetical protein